jgi:hypothetical protein
MADDQDRVSNICTRIEGAIQDSDDSEDIFAALIAVFTFHMSQRCPECRKTIARTLKQSASDMLQRANAAAALRAREGEHTTPCH